MLAPPPAAALAYTGGRLFTTHTATGDDAAAAAAAAPAAAAEWRASGFPLSASHGVTRVECRECGEGSEVVIRDVT